MPQRRRRVRRRLPPSPTQHLPGSPGKILVMLSRLERGYHLHHPRDARDGLSWGLAAWKSRNGKTYRATSEIYLHAA